MHFERRKIKLVKSFDEGLIPNLLKLEGPKTYLTLFFIFFFLLKSKYSVTQMIHVYLQQSPRFVSSNHNLICKLCKAIYGLKMIIYIYIWMTMDWVEYV